MEFAVTTLKPPRDISLSSTSQGGTAILCWQKVWADWVTSAVGRPDNATWTFRDEACPYSTYVAPLNNCSVLGDMKLRTMTHDMDMASNTLVERRRDSRDKTMLLHQLPAFLRVSQQPRPQAPVVRKSISANPRFNRLMHLSMLSRRGGRQGIGRGFDRHSWPVGRAFDRFSCPRGRIIWFFALRPWWGCFCHMVGRDWYPVDCSRFAHAM